MKSITPLPIRHPPLSILGGLYNMFWHQLPSFDFTNNHAVIIGAGLAGTSIAYQLAKQGWQVTILEKQSDIALAASGNPASIVMPLITHCDDLLGQLYFKGYLAALEQMQLLSQVSDKPFFHACGVMDINKDHVAWQNKDHCLDSNYFKLTHYQNKEAFYFPHAGWVDTQLLCHMQLQVFADNINLQTNCEVGKLLFDNQNKQWQIYDKHQNPIINASVVVIANANDATLLEQTQWLPIQKIKGQVSIYPKALTGLDQILVDGHYITPYIPQYGGHVIGATYHRNSELGITDADDLENLQAMQTHFPIDMSLLEKGEIKSWVAYRNSTSDRRALVGPVVNANKFTQTYPDLRHGKSYAHMDESVYYPGLYVNSGYGSRGITSSILSSQYLAQMITNPEALADDKLHTLLLPTRFLVRSLKREKN